MQAAHAPGLLSAELLQLASSGWSGCSTQHVQHAAAYYKSSDLPEAF